MLLQNIEKVGEGELIALFEENLSSITFSEFEVEELSLLSNSRKRKG